MIRLLQPARDGEPTFSVRDRSSATSRDRASVVSLGKPSTVGVPTGAAPGGEGRCPVCIVDDLNLKAIADFFPLTGGYTPVVTGNTVWGYDQFVKT